MSNIFEFACKGTYKPKRRQRHCSAHASVHAANCSLDQSIAIQRPSTNQAQVRSFIPYSLRLYPVATIVSSLALHVPMRKRIYAFRFLPSLSPHEGARCPSHSLTHAFTPIIALPSCCRLRTQCTLSRVRFCFHHPTPASRIYIVYQIAFCS